MVSRRDFLKLGLVGGAGILASRCAPMPEAAKEPRVRLAAQTIPKYRSPLMIPPVMPQAAGGPQGVDYYEIAVRQFHQQVLPPGFPATPVWGYGAPGQPKSFQYPGCTIEARVDRAVRVKWINDLVDADGKYLPHLLPVDPTLHWADPRGPMDMHSMFNQTPEAYRGPVPIVTHLHGAHTGEHSDGYPEAWYLPAAKNVRGYTRQGEWYEKFKRAFKQAWNVDWEPGSAVFQYPNDQRPATLWYHDHAMGMSRLNIHAGLTGFYLLRGGEQDMQDGALPGPAPSAGDAAGMAYFEMPLLIQDRSFHTDGSLFYPDSRAYFDNFAGPYIPESDMPPIWNPEFFGDAMLVNGRTWPRLDVERRRYRFRILNGCNSRFLILKLDRDLPFWVIGADGGFLPAPTRQEQLLLGPAERVDVIVDFGEAPAGTEVMLLNLGPDTPFKGFDMNGKLFGGEDGPLAPALAETTGQVMKFIVREAVEADRSLPPERLSLPAYALLGAEVRTRKLGMSEVNSSMVPESGLRQGNLGLVDEVGEVQRLQWADPVTESPGLGDTEIWEIHNVTEDAHTVHLHQVMFEVVNREYKYSGEPPRPPEAWELGSKDTLICYPNEIARVKAAFDVPGRFVWHCHVLEHEDNEMMRPYQVG